MSASISNTPDVTSFSPERVIRDAANETGADFDFLVRTAARESNFDTQAKARTSSAAGMFQFIEQTWFAMLHRHGETHGYGAMAASITQDSSGRFTVADSAQREEILALRFDPRAASVMAGELAAENAAILKSATGRTASAGELYAAHFLGARGAAGLILAAEAEPGARADQLFPAAAAANRSLFYDRGTPVTAAQLLANLTGASPPPDMPAEMHLASVSEAQSPKQPFTAPVVPGGVSGLTAFKFGDGVLSPALVELLASLKVPDRGRSRG